MNRPPLLTSPSRRLGPCPPRLLPIGRPARQLLNRYVAGALFRAAQLIPYDVIAPHVFTAPAEWLDDRTNG